MKLDITRTRKLLRAFDFGTLFREELGWDPNRYDLTVTVEGQDYSLQTIAHKRGFMALWLKGQIPDYATRRKIDAQVAKSYHEHLIIYTDAGQTEQVWQWVKREAGKPAASRENTFRVNGNGDALLQKLQYLAVTLDEEEQLTILDVNARVKSGFDVEKVTRKFYERFKEEHAAFLKFLKGIPDDYMQRWYVSVTLNRLMFVYFIQKKGFLDGNPDYLRHKLADSRKKGPDRFYADFLCPLFFEGFARREHSPAVRQLLGNVPYLNGGIFERHQIEELHGEKIQIPDAAFERLFNFFDGYQWHLDERPLRRDNEINPDVLGYIFEKYINQKQMGAYYTKEDITEYISKNTIIPHLFDAAGVGDFRSLKDLGSLLASDPDRYIYAAVRHGIKTSEVSETSDIWNEGEIIPESALPDFVQKGMHDPSARMSDKRYNLQMAGPGDPLRLPTETWREYASRRQRCLELCGKLRAGEVTSINDLVTLNLDIRQFAQDVIQDSDADLLAAFWKALTQIKVLDPTVGSGAFLFAALNVLEPLYEACLERMRVLVEELDRSGGKERPKHSPKKYEPFRKVLAQVQKRPNEAYFIFKSIIINNLYGVDIMEEAVEICKLRLFLKLASQVEPDPAQENLGIEPLPDIDFNIRAGNTLVGFATREDVKRSVQFGTVGGVQSEKLFAMPEEDAQLKCIEEKAEDVDRLYKLFRQQQTEYGGEVRPEDKRELQKRLVELEKELNILLSKQYAIHNPKGEAYKKWLASHMPFHWFVEFYGIMNEGGFDVIIGNPPYVEYSKIRKEYELQNFDTLECGNLYALVLERSLILLSPKSNSSLGMIVPISLVCTQRMQKIQEKISDYSTEVWISNYAERPSKLFEGAEVLLTILLTRTGKGSTKTHTTGFTKWASEERPFLFGRTNYFVVPTKAKPYIIPKYGYPVESEILGKIQQQKKTLGKFFRPKTPFPVYYRIGGGRYWKIFTNFQPKFILNGEASVSSRENYLYLETENERNATIAILSSSLFFWYFILTTNGRDLNPSDLNEFPFDINSMPKPELERLAGLSKLLMKDYEKNSVSKEKTSSLTGNIIYKEFYPRLSKPIIDEIDRALARHYGLSDEELDFIIHYDVKYRMGASAGEEEDE